MSGHTKGPLTVDVREFSRSDPTVVAVDIMKGDVRIGSATVRPGLPAEANARLWAASPEMYKAAKDALACLKVATDSGEFDWTDYADALRSALTKAAPTP